MRDNSDAVIYLRVSTDEQANGVLNLPNQEQKDRHYCEEKGYAVVRVFVDPGESARTAKRPEFQKMVAYCKAHRNIGYVVVQDLSRFARNNGDQAEFIAELGRHGVKVRSVMEPNVDETAAGKLAANIHGTFNQYFSDQLSERMKDRSRAAVLAGRWPWPAPIGYRNDSTLRTGANLVPDPERGPHVRRAFELLATGLYTRVDVLRLVTQAGLVTRKGQKLTAQTFYETLRKRVYIGYIEGPDGPVRALHEPLISEALFQRVQDVVDGKKIKAVSKRKHNEEFPLKPFVRCEGCGAPLTGGFARGKLGKRYARHWCRTAGCRAVGLSRTELESQFVGLLDRLKSEPASDLPTELPKMAAKIWAERRGEAANAAKKLTAQLDKQKRLKRDLLEAKLQGEVSQEDYQQFNAEFSREIGDLERELREINPDDTDAAAFICMAELAMMDLGSLWQRASDDQRRRVQTLLFKTGLFYSPKLRSLNPCETTLFSDLQKMNPENLRLASPTGFEPVLPP